MKKESARKIPSDNVFPVVGIGASVGGPDAITRFLGAIPEDSGMACVLIRQLDPNYDSALPELLQKSDSNTGLGGYKSPDLKQREKKGRNGTSY